VITGEDDFICAPVSAREVAEGITGARLELLADCGHFVFVEQPEQFAEAIGAFLAGAVAPGPA
jgi:pimeloyl-ACP methyl ester carboxylesterase